MNNHQKTRKTFTFLGSILIVLLLFLALLFFGSGRGYFEDCAQERAYLKQYEVHHANPELASTFDLLFREYPELPRAFNQRDPQAVLRAGSKIYPTKWGNIVAEFPERCPGWILKGPKFWIVDFERNWKRPAYGDRIRTALSTIDCCSSCIVPREYLYHYPGYPEKISNNNYCVISEKFPLNEQHVEQLDKQELSCIAQVISATDFCDYVSIHENVRRTLDGTILFLDTEPFFQREDIGQWIPHWLWKLFRLCFFQGKRSDEITIERLMKYHHVPQA